jgi:hypothetical protein
VKPEKYISKTKELDLFDITVDYYKHNDSAKAIGQIRHRLARLDFGILVTFMKN